MDQNQQKVDAAVAQVRLALDGGRQIEARVLSGVAYGYGRPKDRKGNDIVPIPNPQARPEPLKPLPEEHSLGIIGYDGGLFVLADPDAASSNTPEPGFGPLYFDSSELRLSTAFNRQDLFVDSDGDHTRYQVILLSPIE